MSPRKKLCLLFSSVALFSSCTVIVPNIRPCAPVEGYPGVGALCTWTNTGDQERLTVDEFIDMLYAQPERPDPKDPNCKVKPPEAPKKACRMLPAHGPSLILSSVDYQKNDTALAQLCVKAKCTYEQKKALDNLLKLPSDAQNLKPKGVK